MVKRYEYLVTLDDRTSEICHSMDGRVFALSKKMIGIKFPLLHQHCRSTVVLYFDGKEDVGKRVARNNRDETYLFPEK